MRIINTKFIFKLVLLFFILLFLSPKPVKAGVISEEIITIDDFDLEDSGKILKTQGYDNIDYKYILKVKGRRFASCFKGDRKNCL